MPSGFEWSPVDVARDDHRRELYQLLAHNYVEDDDALFRFDYSPEFLVWALTPPGADPDFIFGVRSAPAKKLVAFISGVPAAVCVNGAELRVVEINFLCVHKKLRSKRLAPVLIKEMTRRVNLTGVFQAVYTAGTVLPVPVATARYHHRSLNPKKLVNVGFSRLSGKTTLARLLKLYKLPDETSTPGLRPMRASDVPGVHRLLAAYTSKFALRVSFAEEDVAHWLLPRDRVVHSYVVEKPPGGGGGGGGGAAGGGAEEGTAAAGASSDDGSTAPGPAITDLVSFYHLPSSILRHNDTLYSVYSYYNVATSVPLVDLMKDALVLAKGLEYDVFNALDLMDNAEFLEPLKFGLGDGFLQYYIYNWACPELRPSQVGIVLL
jgi:glycylpeptide N-tetradecanoyltransferase